MSARRDTVDELCFAAESLSGTAASTTLRKLGSLMQCAPTGRLFAAIATLSETSARATRALEEGHLALQNADDQEAAAKLALGLVEMDNLATQSAGSAAPGQKPAYLRKTL